MPMISSMSSCSRHDAWVDSHTGAAGGSMANRLNIADD